MADRRPRRRLHEDPFAQQRQGVERVRQFHGRRHADHSMALLERHQIQRRMENHQCSVNLNSNSLMKTTIKFLIATLASALAPCLGHATVSFENAGTTNGWTTLWQEDGQGFVADVGSPAYKGASAIQCPTVFRTTYGGRYHTECRKGGQATLGMDRYYGFAFYLDRKSTRLNSSHVS